MKQEKNIETKAQSQNQQGIDDAVAGFNKANHRGYPNCIKFQSTSILDSQGLGRDGPPGRARSPGTLANQFPDHPPDVQMEDGDSINNNKYQYNNEYQYFNQKTNFNFLQTFNFFIMKKQILILVFLVMATFASVTAFGQAVHNSVPQPISCVDDALHPVAGKAYIYKSTVAAGTGTYEWWATKDNAFIAAGVTNMPTYLKSPTTTVVGTDLIATSANYAAPASAADQVTITWSDALLAATKYQTVPGATPSPTFVAVHYVGAGAECADNLKVYELDPINAFAVDIKNIAETGFGVLPYGTKDSQCPSDVVSATYTAAAMVYDFGVEYLYYEVIATNFSGYFIPTFTLTGNEATQTYAYEYTFADPSTWGGTAPTWTALVSGTTQIPTSVATDLGVSVYIRLTITNHNYEGLTLRPITLAVDAQNSIGTWDIINSTCLAVVGADQNDTAIQDLKPRPTVPSTTTSPTTTNIGLVPGNNVP